MSSLNYVPGFHVSCVMEIPKAPCPYVTRDTTISSSYTTLAEAQVGWSLYRIWYESERVHKSLGYQTPHQRLTINV